MAEAVSLELEDGSSVGRRAAGPRFRTPFGFLAVMRDNPLGFLATCWRQYGDVVEIRFPPWRTFVFVHPDDVRHILQDGHRRYSKGVLFQKLKRIGGEGLVFSDGELWRRQRQLIQPAFHRDRIAAMAPMMVAATGHMLERWETPARNGEPVDVAAEMSRLTLEIVAKALFGTDLGSDNDEFTATVTAAMVYANHLINHFFTPPLFIPTPSNVRGRRAIAGVDRIVWKVIERRRRDGNDRGDLLGMLISARDGATNAAMDDKQLRDEMVTFLIAGHETTAVALSWAWHLLSMHPHVEQRMYAQIADVLGGRPPTADDLAHLPYVRMVFEESMRLYPPVWATAREALEADQVGDVSIAPRTTVTVCQYLTHRHPAFWDDPERFDPERFAPERVAARPDYAYFPFGGGPRGCVGRHFAMLEGQLLLATVAQRFHLATVPGHRVEPYPILTLRPRNGVLMNLTPRMVGTGTQCVAASKRA